MKNAYYFSHDGNARNDEKILMLRSRHGIEGYGIFWILVEMMFESNDTALSKKVLPGIASCYNIDITLLSDVVETCISEQLFICENDVFFSASLRRRKDKLYELKEKRSSAGKLGMTRRWGHSENDGNNNVITNKFCYHNKNNKGKERKVNNIKKDITKVISKEKISYAEFVMLTENEYEYLVS